MRVLALVLTGMFAVCVVGGQASAAKYANPDRTYYQGAGSCGGGASCSYRSSHQKSQKPHKMKKSELTLTLEG